MCRSIKQLRTPDGPPTEEELQAAALQFVRKVSGFRKPSRANQETFDQAVLDIAAVTRRLLDGLVVRQPAGKLVDQPNSSKSPISNPL